MEVEEGTVDWKSAAAMFGNAEDGQGTTEQHDAEAVDKASAPDDVELVAVSVKGRKIMMAPEDAAAIEAFRRDVRERDGRLGGENASLRERIARIEGRLEAATKHEEAAPEIKPPDPRLAVEDLAEWQRQLLAYQAAMTLKHQVELETKYENDKKHTQSKAQQDASDRAWAEGFYTAYPHLNNPEAREVVGTVYMKSGAEVVDAGAIEAQYEKLATLAEAKITRLAATGKEVNAPKRALRLEGASAPRSKMAPEQKFVPVTAASFVARERARLRGEKV